MDSEDIDVMILAAYVVHRINGILGIKRKNTSIDCHSLCEISFTYVIIPLYVHSVCDTTAA